MTFAPKFHTTLQPDFILKLLWRSSLTNKRRVAIGLHEVFQCRFTCRQISTHCFSFRFNQIHFFHTHQRPIRSISRVPKHTLISTELSIYIWFKTEILNNRRSFYRFVVYQRRCVIRRQISVSGIWSYKSVFTFLYPSGTPEVYPFPVKEHK